MQIGAYKIRSIITDHFALDGGAMFGSVPKTLWSKRIAADEKNRIPLACRLLVIEGAGRKFLVDVGMGTKWAEKEREIFSIENFVSTSASPTLLRSTVGAVTDIILTHLHFDHVGGISYIDQDDKLELTFPSARVYLNQRNWEHAQNPGIRERASYLAQNVTPLEQAKLQLTQNGEEIADGIFLYQADGHTPGLQWVLIDDGSTRVAFASDLLPTAHHVSLPYVMGYDMCAETTLREKQAFLERAVSEDWIVVFEHDTVTPAASLKLDEKGRFAVREVVELPSLVSSSAD